jgi:Uma2 family endonuclease
MGEAATTPRRMTTAEFVKWPGEPDIRYELIEGTPVAMNPPMTPHGTIVVSLAAYLHARLRHRRPCRAQAEAGVWFSDEDYFVADLAVTCSPVRTTNRVEEPTLLIEVLSESTRGHDLGTKVTAYQDIASVQEIWAVDSERRRVWVYRRESDHWRIDRYVGSASFASAVVEGELALDDIYENTEL